MDDPRIDLLMAENEQMHGKISVLERLVFDLICVLRDIGNLPQPTAEKIFDDMVGLFEAVAVRLGKTAATNQPLPAIRIAEELRREFLAAK